MTGAATAWQSLERELGAWTAAGRQAEIWWRDDDAGAPCPALDRLLDLAATCGTPLALAVVPARAQPDLAAVLAAHAADAAVLQHGYAHANHAAAGSKKCELVDSAARPEIVGELRRGLAHMVATFGAGLHPVMVPPWNRLAPALIAQLPGFGFAGLSTYGSRPAPVATPGLRQVNCHLDILQWRPQRRFLGTEPALALLTGHLAAKRVGTADDAEPSGILSHHQAHDEAAWDFLAGLLGRLARHPAVRLLPPAEVFAAAPAGAPRQAREQARG